VGTSRLDVNPTLDLVPFDRDRMAMSGCLAWPPDELPQST
jgi:hypothetical protein